jgi:SDR family mycofactocin-dependent oxidoreductase
VGRLEGKVAFISGVARGQGRSHAVRLAEEGVDIIGFDICDRIDTIPYPLATLDDLNETVKLVEERGRRIVVQRADARDLGQTRQAFERGLEALGRIDIVIANAGGLFGGSGVTMEQAFSAWKDGIDVMLTGVMNTIAVALPTLMHQGTGGSIVIISSTAGLKSLTGPVDTPEQALASVSYPVAKQGLVGLMRALAGSLAHHNIRANTVHPTAVNTPFIVNDYFASMFEQNSGTVNWQNALPIDMIEPVDVSNAIVWLCSEEGRYVTGIMLPVDAGFLIR